MKPIKLIADSTCDLSPELIKEYDVTILPLMVLLGDEARRDLTEITSDEMFAWSEANKKLTTTSAPSPEDMEAVLKEFAADYDIIAYTISSEMSSTFQSMTMMAQNDFPDARITVIDSKNLSSGIGLQVVSAGEWIRAGLDYDTVVAKAKELVGRVRAGFIVDDVIHLYKGGRCSALAAFGATALKLHPTLAVIDGFIKVDKKVRGDIRPASMKYAQGLQEQIEAAEDDFVFVTHSHASDETVADLKQYVESFHKFKHVYVTKAGCVIGSHCGKGTIGILFIAKA